MSAGRGAYAGLLGWSVGIYSFLDSEESRVANYWRTIEFGSDSDRSRWPWHNERIVGLWGGGGNWSPFGVSRIEDFTPFFKNIEELKSPEGAARAGRAALLALTKGGTDLSMFTEVQPRRRRRGDMQTAKDAQRGLFFWLMTRASIEQMPFVQGVIRERIQARNAYISARAVFDPVEREMAALRKEVTGLLKHDIGTGKGRREMRQLIGRENAGGPRKGLPRGERASHASMLPSSLGGAPLFSLNASVEVQDMIRDGKGRFSGTVFQDIIRSVNRQVARDFQQEVVNQLTSGYTRPSTGRLAKAHGSPQNRYPRD